MSRTRSAPFLDEPTAGLVARLHPPRSLAARSRRLAAAVCAAAAVLAAVSALTPASDAPVDGEAAAAVLAPVPLPAGAGAGGVAGADRVAVTVRLADAAGTLLLRPGIHVEVVGGAPAGSAATTGDARDAVVLAADAVVLLVPRVSGAAGDGESLLGGGRPTDDQGLEGVAVLSVPPADAHRLAAAAGTRPLSVAVALPAP